MIQFYGHPSFCLAGTLNYSLREQSFRFCPAIGSQLAEREGLLGSTSLTIGTLQIEIGIETNLALYIWGYHPKTSWHVAQLDPPSQRQKGELKIFYDRPLKPAVSLSLAKVGEWQTWFDERNGWICLQKADKVTAENSVEFADNIVAALKGTELVELWLRPNL